MSDTEGGMQSRVDVQFDHHSEDFARHWVDQTAEVRGRCPVAYTEAHGGYWLVTGHPEFEEVALDTDRFVSGRVDGVSSYFIPSMPLELIPLELDPPLQTEIRRTLNPIFTARMADEWQPFVQSAADALIDGFIERGECDLMLDLAKRLTAIVNLTLVGLPASDGVGMFIDAPGIVARETPGSPLYEAALAAAGKMEETVRALIADRRLRPRNDVATVVASMEIDGEPASDDLLMRLIQDVVAAGNSTTTSLIAYSLLWLAEHPAERDRLREDPALLPAAIEELVRYVSPATHAGRLCTATGEVGGQRIEAGERVLLSILAINRDPRVFDRPDEVVLDRAGNRHAAFGFGRHRCLGAQIARMTARTVVERVLVRIPDYRIEREQFRPYERIPAVNGIASLPATFTPGSPVGAAIPHEGPPLPEKLRR